MRVTRTLPCALTSDEVARAADELAACIARLEAADQRRREFLAQIKVEVEAADGTARRLAKMVRTRSEDREIECNVVYDERRYTVDCYRADSGEVVESRPMTEAEFAEARQQTLPGMAKSRRPRRGRLVPIEGDKVAEVDDGGPDDDPPDVNPPDERP